VPTPLPVPPPSECSSRKLCRESQSSTVRLILSRICSRQHQWLPLLLMTCPPPFTAVAAPFAYLPLPPREGVACVSGCAYEQNRSRHQSVISWTRVVILSCLSHILAQPRASYEIQLVCAEHNYCLMHTQLATPSALLAADTALVVLPCPCTTGSISHQVVVLGPIHMVAMCPVVARPADI
jgi:hypothetical protein